MELQPIPPTAAAIELNQKPPLGLATKNAARYPGFEVSNSNTLLGLPQACRRIASGNTVVLNNNPLSFTDPSGLKGDDPIAGGGAVFGCYGAAAQGGEDPIADIGCALSLFGLFGGPSFHGSLKPRPNTDPWSENSGITYGPDIAGALGLPDEQCDFGVCGDGFAGPGMELHHIFPQAFRDWFEQHGIDIDEYTIALARAVHRLKPNGLHTKSGGDWNAKWKEWIDEHPNATPQEIINQGKKFLIEFGVGAGDVFSDFTIIFDPCKVNPNQAICQSAFNNLTMPPDKVTREALTAKGM